MDAKAVVKLGDFSRGGKNRVTVKTLDHDFKPEGTVTPVGLLLPGLGELFLYLVLSKVTSDCLVDILEQWWEQVKARFPEVGEIVLNLDNGPENNSRRTQFMYRLVEFGKREGLTITLAYYPPYHSKYNPVERCWGILEQHWNGDILDCLETVKRFAQSMSWKGKFPEVAVIDKLYQAGVKLSREAMATVEGFLVRLPTLPTWFVTIPCPVLDPNT
jgi:transposase